MDIKVEWNYSGDHKDAAKLVKRDSTTPILYAEINEDQFITLTLKDAEYLAKELLNRVNLVKSIFE